MAEATPIELVHAARYRWRGDLLRLHAGDLDQSATCATDLVAGQMAADSASKTEAAALYDHAADRAEEYVAKLAAFNAGELTRDEWKAYQVEITEERAGIRLHQTGTSVVAALDNFAEPSDAELEASL